ncbi:MAG TPA: TRAP transporter substrate-binding protein DctP [Xanthomonadaceae bacterium]|nr:TRAP transporter substrate-binding protein DctP [Xanthomonadaceae bacterium]
MRLLILLLTLVALPAAAQTQIRLATLAPDGSVWTRELRAAADEIRSETDGRVQIRIFPSGVQGSDATVMRKIRVGQLQGAAFASSEMSVAYKDAVVYGLPFLFRNYDEVDAVRAKVDDVLREGIRAQGLEPVSITGGGFVYLMGKRAIRSRADLRAAKVWVPQNDRIGQVAFQSGGVSPIPLPLGDVYVSLQTGLIDTVGNTPGGAIALQWHTQLEYLIDIPLSFVSMFTVIDQRAMARLSEDDQETVRRVFAESSRRINEINRRDDERAREALFNQGFQRVELSRSEVDEWRKVGEDSVAVLVKAGDLTAEVVEAVHRALADHRGDDARAN